MAKHDLRSDATLALYICVHGITADLGRRPFFSNAGWIPAVGRYPVGRVGNNWSGTTLSHCDDDHFWSTGNLFHKRRIS